MTNVIISDADLRLAAERVFESMDKALSRIPDDQYVASARLDERVSRLYDRYQWRRKLHTAAIRVAILFIAFLVGVSVWLATDVQARAAVQDWFREVYERIFVYRFTVPLEESIFPQYELGWVPEGYTETNRYEGGHHKKIVYTNVKTGDMIVFRYYKYHKGLAIGITGDNVQAERVTVNGMDGDYYHEENNPDDNNLVWFDENKSIVFSISSTESRFVILHIAENTYLVK